MELTKNKQADCDFCNTINVLQSDCIIATICSDDMAKTDGCHVVNCLSFHALWIWKWSILESPGDLWLGIASEWNLKSC